MNGVIHNVQSFKILYGIYVRRIFTINVLDHCSFSFNITAEQRQIFLHSILISIGEFEKHLIFL
jgi:hypothetical protein